jgi:hypothetical protein
MRPSVRRASSSRRRIRRLALLAACGVLLALTAGGSNAAEVRYGNLVLRADGTFSPTALPRHHRAPIDIEGHASISSSVGGPPPQLTQAVLEFDKDGGLSTRGLATCAPAKIEHAKVSAARRLCEDAIVGTGEVQATVFVEGRWLHVLAPLTLFNGPSSGGLATVVAHAQPVSLPDEIYVVSIPIEKTSGEFGYRATIEVPEIFNGTGMLTAMKAKIGRHYRSGGKERSYLSARCSDGILKVHGIFTFADGVVINGSVEKYCATVG